MYKIYIAGSLFTEADVEQRLKEGKLLRDGLQGLDFEIFNPIEQPFNDKSELPTAEAIFKGDSKAIHEATHVLMNLDNVDDLGVFVELGQLLELDAEVYCVMSDSRITNAGEYNELRVPFGFNQYVVGSMMCNSNFSIHSSYREAIEVMLDQICIDDSYNH